MRTHLASLLVILVGVLTMSLCELSKAESVPSLQLNEDTWGALPWIQKDPAREGESAEQKRYKLVYLWGTWCSDCRQKLKGELASLSKRTELEVVTVSIDKDVERLREFLKSEGISVGVRHDPEKTLQKSWKIYAVPFWTLWERSASGWILTDSDRGLEASKVAKAISAN